MRFSERIIENCTKMLNFIHFIQTHTDTKPNTFVTSTFYVQIKIGSFYCKSCYCCCVCFQSSFGHKTDFKKLFSEDTVRRILCRKRDRSKWKDVTLIFTYDLCDQANKQRTLLTDYPTCVGSFGWNTLKYD